MLINKLEDAEFTRDPKLNEKLLIIWLFYINGYKFVQSIIYPEVSVCKITNPFNAP